MRHLCCSQNFDFFSQDNATLHVSQTKSDTQYRRFPRADSAPPVPKSIARMRYTSVHVPREVKVSLLLNIARAYSAQGDYATSAKACSASLSVNPSSAKALYLRGKALTTPASAGAFETEEAIR